MDLYNPTNLQDPPRDDPVRVFGGTGEHAEQFNNTISLFTTVQKKKRVEAAQGGAPGAAAAPLPRWIGKIESNFIMFVAGKVTSSTAIASGGHGAGAGAGAGAGQTSSVLSSGSEGVSGWLLDVYVQRVQDRRQVLMPQSALKSTASVSEFFANALDDGVVCGSSRATIHGMITADVLQYSAQAQQDAAKALPLYYASGTPGVTTSPRTGRDYFLAANCIIDMETGRTVDMKTAGIFLSDKLMLTGQMQLRRCPIPHPLPSIDMSSADNVQDCMSEFCRYGQALRQYFNSGSEELFMQALHVIAASSLQALGFQKLKQALGGVSVLNPHSDAPERGKTFVCHSLLALFGYSHGVVQNVSPSALTELADICSGFPAVIDDIRKGEGMLEVKVHEFFNGQPGMTMARGVRDNKTKVVIVTQRASLGLDLDELDEATFSRILPVEFLLPDGDKLDSSLTAAVKACWKTVSRSFPVLLQLTAKLTSDMPEVRRLLDCLSPACRGATCVLT